MPNNNSLRAIRGKSRRLAAFAAPVLMLAGLLSGCAKPPPVTDTALEDARYALTDLLDDFAACTDAGERLFVVAELVRRTGELTLLTHGAWLGGGKWLARRLEPVAPDLAACLDETAQAALRGAPEGLTSLVTEVLDTAGGPVWEGYRRSGPRKTA